MWRCWGLVMSVVVVERRQRADQAGQHGHRVRRGGSRAGRVQLLVHHRVMGHLRVEIGLLSRVRQFAVQDQVADVHEVAVHGQLFDGEAAVQQLALVAVDVRDADSQAAVDMKPGSNVNMPVWPYSLRMSITSGPTVPFVDGKLDGALPSEKDSVAFCQTGSCFFLSINQSDRIWPMMLRSRGVSSAPSSSCGPAAGREDRCLPNSKSCVNAATSSSVSSASWASRYRVMIKSFSSKPRRARQRSRARSSSVSLLIVTPK